MSLELNLTDADKADEGFKEYPGSCITQRPLIISAGRIPMRAAHLMGMRILHPESDFMSNYFFCDDRVAYSSDNEHVKVGSRGILRPYEEQGVLVEEAMEFSEEHYQQLSWRALKKSELALGRMLSQIEAKAMPVWFELSQRNQQLLDAAVSVTYEYGNFESAMGIYLDSERREHAWMRAAYVFRLEYWSQFDGWCNLDDDNWRLVGLAPEALLRLERRLRDEKGINVDFVGTLGETSNTLVHGGDAQRNYRDLIARDARAIEIGGDGPSIAVSDAKIVFEKSISWMSKPEKERARMAWKANMPREQEGEA